MTFPVLFNFWGGMSPRRHLWLNRAALGRNTVPVRAFEWVAPEIKHPLLWGHSTWFAYGISLREARAILDKLAAADKG